MSRIVTLLAVLMLLQKPVAEQPLEFNPYGTWPMVLIPNTLKNAELNYDNPLDCVTGSRLHLSTSVQQEDGILRLSQIIITGVISHVAVGDPIDYQLNDVAFTTDRTRRINGVIQVDGKVSGRQALIADNVTMPQVILTIINQAARATPMCQSRSRLQSKCSDFNYASA